MNTTRHARTNYKMLAPLLEIVNSTERKHHRFEAPGYMPLSIEYLEYHDYKNRPVYGMMHWTTQNGDLMRDPDMTFSVDQETGTIHPMTYQNDFVGIYQEVYRSGRDGQLLYSPRLRADLDDFLWHWLKNIHEQGYLN